MSNVIFTPYVFRELANAEWVSKVMVLNAKRVSILFTFVFDSIKIK